MAKKKIALVVGTRPNFVKAAPLMRRLEQHRDRFNTALIHTGQHYDHKLSQLLFDELGLPAPDVHLGVGSGSHAEQTAEIMTGLEKTLMESKPDLAVVFGDVNSTLATAVVTSKLWIPLAHVEAGLRNFDATMPEEINRVVTDRLSDYLFVSEQSGLDNLAAEGRPKDRTFLVGNIMIDALVAHLESAGTSNVLDSLGVTPREYAVMTVHRPSNVDDAEVLRGIIGAVREIGRKLPVVFPCHPRTQRQLVESKLMAHDRQDGVRVVEPLGYLDFLKLQSEAKLVITDSGGIQEETTFLRIPCLTIRETTERPVTVEVGTNVVVGVDADKITETAFDVINGNHKEGKIPDLWDGRTSERIVDFLLTSLT